MAKKPFYLAIILKSFKLLINEFIFSKSSKVNRIEVSFFNLCSLLRYWCKSLKINGSKCHLHLYFKIWKVEKSLQNDPFRPQASIWHEKNTWSFKLANLSKNSAKSVAVILSWPIENSWNSAVSISLFKRKKKI